MGNCNRGLVVVEFVAVDAVETWAAVVGVQRRFRLNVSSSFSKSSSAIPVVSLVILISVLSSSGGGMILLVVVLPVVLLLIVVVKGGMEDSNVRKEGNGRTLR